MRLARRLQHGLTLAHGLLRRRRAPLIRLHVRSRLRKSRLTFLQALLQRRQHAGIGGRQRRALVRQTLLALHKLLQHARQMFNARALHLQVLMRVRQPALRFFAALRAVAMPGFGLRQAPGLRLRLLLGGGSACIGFLARMARFVQPALRLQQL